MNNMHAQAIQREITNMLAVYPELNEDVVLRADMLEGCTNMQDFLTQLVREIDDAKALRDGTKARLDELKARQQRFDRRHDHLRELMRKTLEIANLQRMEMPEATVSLRPGPRKVVGDVRAVDLPDDLCRIRREPNLEKIKDALLDGTQIEGLALSNGSSFLTINVR